MNSNVKSFYRIYRPKSFDAVVGQEFITRTLSNQIASQKIGHAYLFCGTRGTGKTSVAKIFADAVNCENFKDGKVCGQCAWCQNPNKSMDIFEIDAASNNGVDAVRDLIESVKYPPVVGKYKVYIIDEVHMFSGAAFNALLKTLEEPPAHVIFVLATTEPHKLLPTVQSRCLRFNFQNVGLADLEKVIKGVFQNEKITADDAAVTLIAKEGQGSVRDALSFADTVAAYCGKDPITVAAINHVVGGLDAKVFQTLVAQIVANDAKGVRETVNQIFNSSTGTARIMAGTLTALKDAYVQQTNPRLANALRIFANLETTLKYANDPHGYFETAALVACGA
ncbi:MAG: DNA polymerase III subunit gamma/tau [Clostridia bacterium]|nr:DNA polymerase III subunit gamma/tau [Clostridia bacterium]